MPSNMVATTSHDRQQGTTSVSSIQHNDDKNLISVYIVTHQAAVGIDTSTVKSVAAKNTTITGAATVTRAGAAGNIHVRALADS